MTLQDEIDELGEKLVMIEKQYDEAVAIIEWEIKELASMACETCEGMGEFKYREFFERCHDCGGTGYARKEAEYEPD
jgi:DnaJ-class molecular chaperone